MAKTGKVNVVQNPQKKDFVIKQIEQLKQQLEQKLNQYKNQNGKEYPLKLTTIDEEKQYDFVNPQHYVQNDGKQTWERMIDKWGLEQTALWCEMTVFKYEDRLGKKPGEDIQREKNKIEWYKNKAIELREIIKKKKIW